MRDLPEDDWPHGARPIPNGDDAAAAAEAGDLSDPRNPMSTAFAFYNSVTADGGPDVAALRLLCTPESWGGWGDFSAIVEMIGDCGLAARADAPSTGERGVRYAKVVALPDPGQAVQAEGDVLVNAWIITMQWRPADGYWRVHGFGDYILPENLPPV